MAEGSRFHKAAQDGNLDILKEATKRDTNAKDEDGMTPVLWAASCGHLDALRLLVGRGGDVEKANYHFGQSALHLAAVKGHLPCVSFLVGFDANLFALDHDLHTPLQIATHKDVIDFLDKATTNQLANNKKEVKQKKEKALKDAERRKKKYEDKMRKERDKEEKRMKKVEKERGTKIDIDVPIPTAPNRTIRKAVVEVNGPSFTEIVGGTITKKPAVVKKILDKTLGLDEKFEHSRKGTRGTKGDAQIIYVSSYDNPICGKRGKISDVFNGHILANGHNKASIFDRPGFGSVAFRQRANLAGTLSGLPGEVILEKEVEEDESEEASIGSAGSLGQPRRNGWQPSWAVDATSDENEVDNGQWTPLERFLVSAGVEDYKSKLLAQQIDLEAVLMLTEQDLIELGFPMGPRKKLLHAIKQRQMALNHPGHMKDTKL